MFLAVVGVFSTQAECVFGEMVVKDAVSSNSMIVGYKHNSLLDDAIGLIEEMPSRNVVLEHCYRQACELWAFQGCSEAVR